MSDQSKTDAVTFSKGSYLKDYPLTTIVISSYNRPRLIRDALESVLAQTWPNIQVIIADDWSDRIFRIDETPSMANVEELCFSYARKFHPTKSIEWRRPAVPPTPHERQYGQRVSVCINAAMPFAKGEFVCFLPDDDFLTPRSVEVRTRYLMEHPKVNCVYGQLEACKVQQGGDYLPTPHGGTGDLVREYYFGVTMPEGYTKPTQLACVHDRDGFWSLEPIARAANKVDHGMMMVRRLPNILEGPLFGMAKMTPADLPKWPEIRTAIHESIHLNQTREALWMGTHWDANPGSQWDGCWDLIALDCPDAGWFFRLELAGLGPFHSVPAVVVVKRYHSHGHRTAPTVRE